jgi:methyl-accepting chemotaxis protein
MMTAMNGIASGLAGVVTSICQGSEQVATPSAQIAAGNQDLSSRTEHQAGAPEETASSTSSASSTALPSRPTFWR